MDSFITEKIKASMGETNQNAEAGLEPVLIDAGFDADDISKEDIRKFGITLMSVMLICPEMQLPEFLGTIVVATWINGYKDGKMDGELNAKATS